jgi:hypothetical protein
VIGRSETRDTPRNPVATLETALLFGTRVAKPILAAVMCAVRPLDRTYDRKRSDPRLLHLLLRAGGRPHMGSGSRDPGRSPGVASAGMTIADDLRLSNLWIQIIPIWIELFDELNFPGPIPFLQTLFAQDRGLNIAILFEVHEPMNSVLFREAVREPHLMFIDSPNQIIRYPDVKRSAYATGENVHPIGSFAAHQERLVVTGSSAKADDDRNPAGSHG